MAGKVAVFEPQKGGAGKTTVAIQSAVTYQQSDKQSDAGRSNPI